MIVTIGSYNNGFFIRHVLESFFRFCGIIFDRSFDYDISTAGVGKRSKMMEH